MGGGMFRHKINFLRLALFLTCLVYPSILFAENYEGKVVNVLSGDTIIISIGGKEYKTTLANIATPLQGQNFYDEAKQFVVNSALNQKVSFSTKAEMAFNPETISAEVFVPKKRDSLNRELVRAGLAWGENKKSEINPYVAAIKLAKNRRLGIWSETNPQPPWEFAAAKKEQALIAAEKKAKEEREKPQVSLNEIKLTSEQEKYLAEHAKEIKKAQTEEEQRNTIKEDEKKKNAPDKIRELMAYKSEDIDRMDDVTFRKYSNDFTEACSLSTDSSLKKVCDITLFSLKLRADLRNLQEERKTKKASDTVALNEKKAEEQKKKPKVSDIDLFTISARLINNEIEVSLTYKNKITGFVFWEDDSLDCHCEFKSGIVEDSKTLTLSNHRQNMYLKVDWSEMNRQAYKFDAGRVTCTINPYGTKLEATDTVYLRY